MSIRDGVHSTGQMRALSDGREIFEQSLVVKSAAGLSVICGCAHPGVVNIVEGVTRHFGQKVIFLGGGFHLKDETIARIDSVIARLRALGVEKVAPLHCTGKTSGRSFKKAYGNNCIPLKVAEVLEL